MKKLLAVSTAVLSIALLTGCGGGDSETETAASGSSTGSTKSASAGDLERSLKETAQGYYDAMVKGNVMGMSAYFPKECEDETGMMMLGSQMLKDMLEGVTRLRVTEVKVEGTRGQILDGEVEGKVSDATKRLFENDEQSEDDIWQYKDGKWWTTCDATFATASPSPSTTAEA